ncbi:TDT family transporter [Enterovibrio makurazakiensis]|uniref:TDT family transporter n=1 Tax=Enterovibrio gelatinilyticus TaxID=2899819 RepID=A0ABT5QVU5_9GAMM|nr:TDT family transporter [Enterovibrio sp. ZSDZ42]MDD1792133.1 TDT family transporter [Enterovibrio sp. ZSDZ42]
MDDSLTAFHSPFRFIPTAQASLAMAYFGLGVAWSLYHPFTGDISRPLLSTVGILLIGGVWLKYVFEPKRFFQDLRDPLYGSLMAPMTMSLLLMADFLSEVSVRAAIFIWYPAVVMHIFMMCYFFFHQFKSFDKSHIYPSWFLYPVGLISSTLAGPKLGFGDESELVAHICIAAYFCMLPFVLYRLCFLDSLPRNSRPVLAIMAAPVNLALTAYLVNMTNPDPVLAGALAGVGIMMTLFVYLCYFDLLREPFQPTLAALTFPSVISAVAMERLTLWLGTDFPHWSWLERLGLIELTVATLLVSWVSFGYIRHYGFGK